MFNYFHKNKPANAEKGQLAAVFIAVIVVLIVMSMVTVNLGKVAFIKTDSANSVDSGGLAAGSAMANVFNSVTVSSSKLKNAYDSFLVSITLSIFIVSYDLIMAQISTGEAMSVVCIPTSTCSSIYPTMTASTSLTDFMKGMGKIALSIAAFWYAQLMIYKSVRENAVKGWKNAMKAGYGSAFGNSGIGSKLTPTQRDDFSDFVDNLDTANSYSYAWADGQGRQHSVVVNLDIQEIDPFEMKVTNADSIEIALIIVEIISAALIAQGLLDSALAPEEVACINTVCCPSPCGYYSTCPALFAACAAAEGLLIGAMAAMVAADIGIAALLAGLQLNGCITSTEGDLHEEELFCWVSDIIHDRLVNIDTTQNHEGADLGGMWQTEYPTTNSDCIVDFSGDGQASIGGCGSDGDFRPRHDASIIQTDQI